MTSAILGGILLAVVCVMAFRDRRIVYPLCAVALGIVIGEATGPIGSLETLLDAARGGFATLSNSLFR